MIGTWDAKAGTSSFSWHELADAWRANAAGTLPMGRNAHKLEGRHQWTKDPRWQGFTVQQADEWLAKGYTVDDQIDVGFAPKRLKRRIRNGAEGDLDYGAYLTGAENPFSLKSKAKTAPGIDIDADVALNSGVPSNVVQSYLLWLNRVAYSVESQGSDLSLSLTWGCSGLFGKGYDVKTNTRIVVKKAGEFLDPQAWSPILSPAGMRGFIFMSAILTAENAGHEVNRGLGMPSDGVWDVTLVDGILKITSPSGPRFFPEERMTARVIELIGNR